MTRPEQSPSLAPGAWARRAGLALSAITVLILAMSAFAKLAPQSPEGVEALRRFGYPEGTLVEIAAIEIACMLLYVFPRTTLVGAVLLTGYLGGAVATHVRASDVAFLFPVFVGVMAWGGLYLRDMRLRRLVPLPGFAAEQVGVLTAPGPGGASS